MLWKGSTYELTITNVILEEELYYVGNDKSTKKKVLTEVMNKTKFICKKTVKLMIVICK